MRPRSGVRDRGDYFIPQVIPELVGKSADYERVASFRGGITTIHDRWSLVTCTWTDGFTLYFDVSQSLACEGCKLNYVCMYVTKYVINEDKTK